MEQFLRTCLEVSLARGNLLVHTQAKSRLAIWPVTMVNGSSGFEPMIQFPPSKRGLPRGMSGIPAGGLSPEEDGPYPGVGGQPWGRRLSLTSQLLLSLQLFVMVFAMCVFRGIQ
jgi:hypothetical protein